MGNSAIVIGFSQTTGHKNTYLLSIRLIQLFQLRGIGLYCRSYCIYSASVYAECCNDRIQIPSIRLTVRHTLVFFCVKTLTHFDHAVFTEDRAMNLVSYG